jgi:hypothetical protein
MIILTLVPSFNLLELPVVTATAGKALGEGMNIEATALGIGFRM